MTAVLVDLQGHVADVNLLDDLDRFGVGQVQVPSAGRAGVEEVVGGDGGEHLGREQLGAGVRYVPAGRRACAAAGREAAAAWVA